MHVHFLLIQVSLSFYLEPFSHDNNKSQGFLPSCHTKVSTHLGGGGGGGVSCGVYPQGKCLQGRFSRFCHKDKFLGGMGYIPVLNALRQNKAWLWLYYSSSKAPRVLTVTPRVLTVLREV